MYTGLFDGLGEAFSLFLVPGTLLILTIALVVGMFTSIIPGIGSVATLALLLTFTLGMEPHIGIAFLVVLIGAGGFSGSMTAILINVPGETQNAASLLDGYPMSQKGRAGEAIGASATASALGAAFGVLVLIGMIPIIRAVILAFGPPEMFALTLAGVALIAVISRGNAAKGLVSGMAGMGLGFIGLAAAIGEHRYTFGVLDLLDGLRMVPVIIGLFAVPEIFELLRKNRAINRTGRLDRGGVTTGVMAVLRRPWLLIRSSAIGVGVGVVPGVGGSVAPWVAYFVAKARSKDPDSFGTGNIEGVIAPEASNDAKDGGALMPLLAFGIPGSLTMAIVLSAFLFHGVTPGPRLFEQNMHIIWMMILALLFANFGSSIIGLGFANLIIKVTMVPAVVLGPIVIAVAMVGSFADHGRIFSVYVATVIGLVGIGMRRAGYHPAPMIVGFVLMPLAERYFLRSVRLSRGGYDFLLRPITFSILLIIALSIFGPVIVRGVKRLLEQRRTAADQQRRANAGVASGPASGPSAFDRPDGATPPSSIPSVEAALPDDEPEDEYSPRAGIVMTVLFAGFAVFLLANSGDISEEGQQFPLLILVPMALISAVLLLKELRGYLSARREGRATRVAAGAFPEWWVTIWVLLGPVTLVVFGMTVGSGLYVAFARYFFDRSPNSPRKLLIAAVLGVSTAVAIRAIFTTMLGVRLTTGLIW